MLFKAVWETTKNNLENDHWSAFHTLGKSTKWGQVKKFSKTNNIFQNKYNMYVYILNICSSMYAESLSHVWFFATPWTVAHQAPLSMEFPRWEYWNGLPFPALGDLPDPVIEPVSLSSPVRTGGFFTTYEIHIHISTCLYIMDCFSPFHLLHS